MAKLKHMKLQFQKTNMSFAFVYIDGVDRLEEFQNYFYEKVQNKYSCFCKLCWFRCRCCWKAKNKYLANCTIERSPDPSDILWDKFGQIKAHNWLVNIVVYLVMFVICIWVITPKLII